MLVKPGEFIGEKVAREVGASSRETNNACGLIDILATTEGVKLTREQITNAAILGATVRPYDDLFDQDSPETAKIDGNLFLGQLTGEPILNVAHFGERIRKLIRMIQDSLSLAAYSAFTDLTRAQIDSINQRDAHIDLREVQDITYRKGASALLVFALTVNPNMTPERINCYSELGYLIQLIDDFEDIQKDSRSGVVTLFTANPDANKALILIEKQYRKVRLLFTTIYSPKVLDKLLKHIDSMMRGIGFQIEGH